MSRPQELFKATPQELAQGITCQNCVWLDFRLATDEEQRRAICVRRNGATAHNIKTKNCKHFLRED